MENNYVTTVHLLIFYYTHIFLLHDAMQVQPMLSCGCGVGVSIHPSPFVDSVKMNSLCGVHADTG